MIKMNVYLDLTFRTARRPRPGDGLRAKVEHSIGVIKRVFGFQKIRYRGRAKNLHRLEVAAARANLFTVRRRLPAPWGSCR